jgi:chromate transport protein ChrA
MSDPAAVHSVALYAVCAAVLLWAAADARPSPPSAKGLLKYLWPFGVLALLGGCVLNMSGQPCAEWAAPALAATVVALVARSPRPKVWVLVAAAVAFYVSGNYLLLHGYTYRAEAHNIYSAVMHKAAPPQWYTPLTGLRPAVKPPPGWNRRPPR